MGIKDNPTEAELVAARARQVERVRRVYAAISKSKRPAHQPAYKAQAYALMDAAIRNPMEGRG